MRGKIDMTIADIQEQFDPRGLTIDNVGVKDISYPINVLDRSNGVQHTVGRINMFVELPEHFKGTHMSRFVEILNEYHGNISVKNFGEICKTMKDRLSARKAHLEVSFPYFIKKEAPVSKVPGLMEYFCRIEGMANEKLDLVVEVHVPILTLCPCSKEISERGAHNQRGEVTVRFRFKKFKWIEDIIELVESCASSGVYSVLKREDEKFVTEHAYDNPVFVEDLVREVAIKLIDDPDISWFRVNAESFESIHNHSAYASLERGDKKPHLTL